jgi:hypothetical protein
MVVAVVVSVFLMSVFLVAILMLHVVAIAVGNSGVAISMKSY